MSRIKPISKYLLAIFMIVAGTMHFVNPEFFLKIVPPYLPLHKELVLVSGVCEILLGILLLDSKMFTFGGVGNHRPVDCRVSCQHLSLPASGYAPGLTAHSPVAIAVAGGLHSVGLLAYETGREETMNLKPILQRHP